MVHGSRCRSFKRRVGTLMVANLSQLSRSKHNHFRGSNGGDSDCSNMTATVKSNIEKDNILVIPKDQSSDSNTMLNVKSCIVLAYFVSNLLVINI